MQRTRLVVAACIAVFGAALIGTALSSPYAGPGGLILFHKEGGAFGEGQIFTIRPDGTGLRQITRGPSWSLNADWSPDGQTIVFEHIAADESSALVSLMNPDGTNVRALTPEGFQGQPSFSSDGGTIVYNRDPSPTENGVWAMKVDGTDVRRLTRNPFYANGNCGCDQGPKLSPDGRTVAFARIRRDDVSHALFSVQVDGTGLRPLLPYLSVVGTHLDWSPDGRRIAVTIGANALPGKSANVATVDPNGKTLRWVTRFRGGLKNAFVGGYSPDGKWLVIRIDQGATHGLYLAHPDGTALHRIYVSRDIERGIDWGKGTS